MDTAAATRALPGRLRFHRLALWLFFASESLLFLSFLIARFYLHGVQRPSELNQPLGLAITTILLASSLTANRAEMAVAHGDRPRFLRNILATILLGVLFLAGVGIEWAEGVRHFPPRDAYGTAFFTMTGIHAAHVLSGVVMLLLVYVNGRRGVFTGGNYWGVEGVVKYWHFVDVVWVFFYPTLYLVS